MVSQVSMVRLHADASVIVREPFVHVALPTDEAAVLSIWRISSPGAMRAAVAPDVNVFQRNAKEVPALASLPPTGSM